MEVGQASLAKIAEKEVQDTSCRGSAGCPPTLKVPQDWGIRGLIKTIQESVNVRDLREHAEKEVQDTSCWGSGGIPQN